MIRLVDIVDSSAEARPESVAVCCGGQTYTYEDLKRRVGKLVAVLWGLGVREGDRVALLSCNSVAHVELVFACARLGAVCVQCNVRLSKSVTLRLLEESGARVVILSEAMERRISDGLDELDKPVTRIVIQGSPTSASLSYEELLDAAAESNYVAPEDPERPVLMLYTSGTTGVPRGVVFSHEAIERRIATDRADLGITPDTISLCVLPMYHITLMSSLLVLQQGAQSHEAIERRIATDRADLGITPDTISLCVLPMYHITLMSSLLVLQQGAQLVISDSRDAASIAALVDHYHVTFVGLVPFVLRALVEYLEDRREKLTSLQTVLYGGEPIDKQLLARSQAVLGCGFIQGYGMTETASAITLLRPEQHLKTGKLTTVGTPVSGVKIKIVDDRGAAVGRGVPGEILVKTDMLMIGYFNDEERTAEAMAVSGVKIKIVDDRGAAVGRGVPGEILVKTDMLMIGYFNDEERTAEAMADGWYRTGDIGQFDEDGYLVLLDRKSNMVISGGENVYPSEVSACIKRLSEDVDDVVVFGVPDDYWGEALVAAVVRKPSSSLTAADVAEWCKRQLGDYKKPKHVIFVPEIKRSATGKPDKSWLLSLRAQGE